MTSTDHRSSYLTTAAMHDLDAACGLIRQAFGCPYLVGSALEKGTHRDVDVRLILDDDEFDALFREHPKRWELLSLALGDYLRQRTGLPIDFQIQRMTEANAKHPGMRNPLGMGRTFAGGGDATPDYLRNI